MTEWFNISSKHNTSFDKHFGKSDDEHVWILTAHLLMEEALRDFCYRKVRHHKYLLEARLSFNQVFHLAHAMSIFPQGDFDEIWDAIGQLNKLRNMMAHELEPSGAKSKMLKDSIIELGMKRSTPDQRKLDLSEALAGLCGALSALLQADLIHGVSDEELKALRN